MKQLEGHSECSNKTVRSYLLMGVSQSCISLHYIYRKKRFIFCMDKILVLLKLFFHFFPLYFTANPSINLWAFQNSASIRFHHHVNTVMLTFSSAAFVLQKQNSDTARKEDVCRLWKQKTKPPPVNSGWMVQWLAVVCTSYAVKTVAEGLRWSDTSLRHSTHSVLSSHYRLFASGQGGDQRTC